MKRSNETFSVCPFVFFYQRLRWWVSISVNYKTTSQKVRQTLSKAKQTNKNEITKKKTLFVVFFDFYLKRSQNFTTAEDFFKKTIRFWCILF